jgi:hypothetical protein
MCLQLACMLDNEFDDGLPLSYPREQRACYLKHAASCWLRLHARQATAFKRTTIAQVPFVTVQTCGKQIWTSGRKVVFLILIDIPTKECLVIRRRTASNRTNRCLFSCPGLLPGFRVIGAGRSTVIDQVRDEASYHLDRWSILQVDCSSNRSRQTSGRAVLHVLIGSGTPMLA